MQDWMLRSSPVHRAEGTVRRVISAPPEYDIKGLSRVAPGWPGTSPVTTMHAPTTSRRSRCGLNLCPRRLSHKYTQLCTQLYIRSSSPCAAVLDVHMCRSACGLGGGATHARVGLGVELMHDQRRLPTRAARGGSPPRARGRAALGPLGCLDQLPQRVVPVPRPPPRQLGTSSINDADSDPEAFEEHQTQRTQTVQSVPNPSKHEYPAIYS
jgi:hypothetical protein